MPLLEIKSFKKSIQGALVERISIVPRLQQGNTRQVLFARQRNLVARRVLEMRPLQSTVGVRGDLFHKEEQNLLQARLLQVGVTLCLDEAYMKNKNILLSLSLLDISE